MSTSTEIVPRGPGRPCTLCSLSTRELQAVEADIADGLSLRGIARRHDLSNDSVRRHLNRHMSPEARLAATALGLTAASVASRLVNVADSLHDNRVDCEDRGDLLTAVRAADAEARVLRILADRLGIASGDALRDIQDAEAFADAIGWTARHEAETAERLALALEATDHRALANTLRAVVTEQQRGAA